MNDTAKITYLFNSGFILETDNWAMIFDYYLDEHNLVLPAIENKREVYFFASHAHFDHYNPQIAKFSGKTTRYFLSYDIKKALPPENKRSFSTSTQRMRTKHAI